MSDEEFVVVDVLIARMESDPKDFLPGNKFYRIANSIYEISMGVATSKDSETLVWVLTEDEKARLIAAYKKFCRKKFQETVLHSLLKDNSAPDKVSVLAHNDVLWQAKKLLEDELENGFGAIK